MMWQTRNVVSGWAQYLAARPKRMLFEPDQLNWAPTSTLSLTFWNIDPENSFPSFLNTTHSTDNKLTISALPKVEWIKIQQQKFYSQFTPF